MNAKGVVVFLIILGAAAMFLLQSGQEAKVEQVQQTGTPVHDPVMNHYHEKIDRAKNVEKDMQDSLNQRMRDYK